MDWSGEEDSNLRPPAPKAGTHTRLSYLPTIKRTWRALSESNRVPTTYKVVAQSRRAQRANRILARPERIELPTASFGDPLAALDHETPKKVVKVGREPVIASWPIGRGSRVPLSGLEFPPVVSGDCRSISLHWRNPSISLGSSGPYSFAGLARHLRLSAVEHSTASLPARAVPRRSSRREPRPASWRSTPESLPSSHGDSRPPASRRAPRGGLR